MRTLLIDNYDSFTFNLAHLVGTVCGQMPLVVRNDEATWDDLTDEQVDAVVISPGPGRPERHRDVGLSAEAVRRARVPLLGVCLGHQTIAHVLGGRIDHAPEPVHGRRSKVHHDGTGVLAGVPSPFTVVRYHSLHVADVPPELVVCARSEDGVTMALRHVHRPLWGVQFHPESICAEQGRRIVASFVRLARAWSAEQQSPAVRRGPAPPPSRPTRRGHDGDAAPPWRQTRRGHDGDAAARTAPAAPAAYRLLTRDVDAPVDPERAFVSLYGGAAPAFWLDSATAGHPRGRWSFMGDATGPHAETLTYDVRARRLVRTTSRGATVHRERILDHLARELDRRRLPDAGLPFGFDGGYVGYLGYELQADCGGPAGAPAETPDAAFVFADRFLAFDHAADRVTVCALATGETAVDATAWLEATADRLRDLASRGPLPPPAPPDPAPQPAVRYRAAPYRGLVASCLEHIRDGESYELCLTNAARLPAPADALEVYRRLRRGNPAPHAAYLRLPGVTVLSSSPERFLSVDRDGLVETCPIKGTRRRSPDAVDDRAIRDELAISEKDLAENLMITDLARHDLGRVCELGSVHVQALFDVETYETVHQLVTTVRGRLRPDRSVVEAVTAAFPPGSMTGAPKRRTTELLAELEVGPRGVYAGALGYLGLGGACDLSVVIRSLVVTDDAATFGVGGAIVALSDPQAEWEETLVKAEPLLAALGAAAPLIRTARR